MHTHLNPRGAALAAGAGVLAAVMLATGCDGTAATASAGARASFSTVRFTVGGPGGDVQLSGMSRSAVRPAGSHTVTAGRAHRFTRPEGRLLVVLRHWPAARIERASRGRLPRMRPPEESAVETAFVVNTAGWVRADLDGAELQWLRGDTIRVDATNTAAGDVTHLTLSGPYGGRSGQPVRPPGTRACTRSDDDDTAARRATLPDIEAGSTVPKALGRLSSLCLDIQYTSRPDSGRPGTVHQVLIPLATHPTATAALPPPPAATPSAPGPGERALLDPTRPATVVVAR